MQTDKRYRMEVKHRWSAPRRYTWEIFDGSRALPRFESRVLFLSWEEASIAGKIALAEIKEAAKISGNGRRLGTLYLDPIVAKSPELLRRPSR